jgi:hypothetical protein
VVLRNSGDEDGAREVLIAKQDARRAGWNWCWYRLAGYVTGYGYRPWRAFWIAGAVVVLGCLVFDGGYRLRLFMPSRSRGYLPWPYVAKTTSSGHPLRVPQDYPKFHSLKYSIDVFLPLEYLCRFSAYFSVIELRQANHWKPDADAGRVFGWRWLTLGKLLRLYRWTQTFLGWAFAAALVAGLSGWLHD